MGKMFACPAVRAVSPVGVRCTAFHSSPTCFQLSVKQTEIVKSTAPVLADHGIAITTHFYKRMLDNHPELNNIFNKANQCTGAQPLALANSLYAYATNIDNLGALKSAVSRIGNKHASLGVTAEQYSIVGENLLASMKEILGDAADESVMDAWNAAYEQLADLFIQFESDLYEKAANTPGGWEGWRKFTVSQKIHESDEIISFYLNPSDKGALPSFVSGQFVSIRVFVPELGVYQPRQYSLSDIPDGKHLRISVKKELATEEKPPGRISSILHEHLPEGSELDVSMPFGDFTLDVNTNTPVVLISGGVGITPMISMLMNVVEHGKDRRVVFVHAVRNGHVHAMKDFLSQTMSKNPQVSRAIFYEEVTENEKQGLDYDYQGWIELGKIKEEILLPDANYYLCGPVPFMSAQQKDLEGFGIPSERIHSEVFGSGLMV